MSTLARIAVWVVEERISGSSDAEELIWYIIRPRQRKSSRNSVLYVRSANDVCWNLIYPNSIDILALHPIIYKELLVSISI